MPSNSKRKSSTAQPVRPLQCKKGCDVIDRLAAYEERLSGVARDDKELLIPALGWRSYHLPGYSYCEDWLQYFQNNHPLLSLCCHHRLHPIGFGMRLVFLIGSVVVGLLLTNISWLCFYFTDTDQNEPAVTITLSSGGIEMQSNNTGSDMGMETGGPDSEETFQITQGMLLLWTLGGALHALFDNTVWYITACVCCIQSKQHHRFKSCGSYCVIVLVLFVTTMATLVVLFRSTIETEEEQDQDASKAPFSAVYLDTDETVSKLRFQKAESYSFLLSYAMELVLALGIYNPIVGTVLFSGILGCGRLPVLGGRPYEVWQEEQRLQEEQLENSCSSVA